MASTPRSLGTDSHYLPTLDGWRALAILGVMICHSCDAFFHAEGPHPNAPLHSLTRHGALGVDVFFRISGFLICSHLIEEQNEKRADQSEAVLHSPGISDLASLLHLLGSIRIVSSRGINLCQSKSLVGLSTFLSELSAGVAAGPILYRSFLVVVDRRTFLFVVADSSGAMGSRPSAALGRRAGRGGGLLESLRISPSVAGTGDSGRGFFSSNRHPTGWVAMGMLGGVDAGVSDLASSVSALAFAQCMVRPGRSVYRLRLLSAAVGNGLAGDTDSSDLGGDGASAGDVSRPIP